MDKKIEKNYIHFLAMIMTSTIIMFFLTYLNSSQIINHAWFSETRFYMSLIMGSCMTLVMLLFMLKMYNNKSANLIVILTAGLVFFSALILVRSQATVTDVDYMEGMIPHHSIAILTSKNAKIRDIRVRKLADGIIEAQQREIKEMEWLISDIKKNGIVEMSSEKLGARKVPNF